MSNFKEKIKSIMDSTFGSSPSRLKTDDSLLKTDYTTKGNSIEMIRNTSKNKHFELKDNIRNNHRESIQKIQSDINSFDLKRKSKSNINPFKDNNASDSRNNIPNEMDFQNKENNLSNKEQMKIVIDSFFSTNTNESDSRLSSDKFPSRLKKQSLFKDKSSKNSNLCEFNRLINNKNNYVSFKSPNSKIFKEISSYANTLKGFNNGRESIKNQTKELNSSKINLKTDINYYLNYLSPTNRKASFSNSNNEVIQKYSSDIKLIKCEKNCNYFGKSKSKKEKNISEMNEMESFTKEFSMLNNQNKKSLLKDKLGIFQSRLLTERTYLK